MVNSKWGLLKFYFQRMHFVCKKKNVHDHKNDDDNDEWNEIVITAHKICSSFLFLCSHEILFPKIKRAIKIRESFLRDKWYGTISNYN